MRRRKRSRRKRIWIILAILSISTMVAIISSSEVENKNVAKNETENTKVLISKQDSTKTDKESKSETAEVQPSKNTGSDSSMNSKPNSTKKETVSKDTSKEVSSNTKPAHKHEWEAETKTENITSQVPVYGDVCRTCGQNVTGKGDIHILEGTCIGYDTDVIVSYKEVTETVSHTVYKCSCGATK